jgi:hypothetical protein
MASSLQPGQHIIYFKYAIGSFMHTATAIRRLGRPVLSFDIQAQSAHCTLLLREGLCVSIEGAKDSAASKLTRRVYTLNPPEHAIAPIGPLVGDHHLANPCPVGFRNQIKPAPRIIENCMKHHLLSDRYPTKEFRFQAPAARCREPGTLHLQS